MSLLVALVAGAMVAGAVPAEAAARTQKIALSINLTSLVSGQTVTFSGGTTPKAKVERSRFSSAMSGARPGGR